MKRIMCAVVGVFFCLSPVCAAETAALAAPCVPDPGVTAAELVFSRPMTPNGLDPNAPLVLVWSVDIDGKSSDVAIGCNVWVNALTGDTQVVARH